MKIRNSDVIWGYLGIGLNTGINIILLPLILSYLSGNELGLWYVYSSVGSVVTLLDFGFAPALARSIAYCFSGVKSLRKETVEFQESDKPNFELMSVVLVACRKIYFVISIVALILLSTIGSIYILYISKQVDTMIVIISWIIYSIAVFFNMYIGYYSSFLKGISAIRELNIATVVSKVSQILISVVLLFLNLGLIAITFAYLISGFINRIICKYSFFTSERMDPDINSKMKTVTNEQVKELLPIIWHNASKDGLVTLSQYLVGQAGTIVCSLFLSLEETGIYSLTMQIITIISSFSSVMYTVSQPSLQASVVHKDMKRSKELLGTAMLFYCFLFIFCSALLCTIGIPVIRILKPDQPLQVSFTVVMCIYMFLLQNHSLFASYISNSNVIPYVKPFIISGVLSILLETLLMTTIMNNKWALVIAPMIIQAAYNNWKWPTIVLNDMNVNYFQLLGFGISEVKRKFLNRAV